MEGPSLKMARHMGGLQELRVTPAQPTASKETGTSVSSTFSRSWILPIALMRMEVDFSPEALDEKAVQITP